MKLGIIGTRGIPNHHGGFEQFTEYFSVYMANAGHEVYVYNSHLHPFQEKQYKGVNLIHKRDMEDKIGTAGQFVYDLNCIIDAKKRDFDLILQLGYTSSSVWGSLLPKKTTIVTNMDGLEWKRSKYNGLVQKFLKRAEKWAINTSDFLVSDSIGIQSYIKETYQKNSEYIAYGAEIFGKPDKSVLDSYGLMEENYNMLIARLEPENNIETILDGVVKSNDNIPFVVVGKYNSNYGETLRDKYKDNLYIRFFGGIYDIEHLNNLRFFSKVYFHGHSVGGTNPSLLEAMASQSLIAAHDNIFNKSILGDNAFYFRDKNDVAALLSLTKSDHDHMIKNNLDKIEIDFKWDKINGQYEKYLLECLSSNA
ncbi:DUF1972 domain-containing protein [Flagellimonas amoyensis]|uniref:DUF1972 domain-containing protein n=1 Tax=Flagellimonas amoyensis TaxID=2169401 RepID=UPI000D36B8EB|nr:DUF1972 domain-containing protein [Allomuricauda amoyensis]